MPRLIDLHTAARRVGTAALLAAALALGGCATLPDEGRRSYTTALVPKAGAPATPLERIAQASMVDAPAGQSGFRLLLGAGGLDARVLLLRDARRSLDLQSFHLQDDASGRLVLRELRNAAQRGVRVRLLLDDVYTDGLEALLDGLGAYPNVEVRLFNPFPTRGSLATRFAAALFDVVRVNRRMHNKLFVADGAWAVTGGRNLGDEYFMRSREANFFDHDVLVAGPVVPQMASLFDEYWNAPQVRTAASVLRPADPPAQLRRAFDDRVDGPDTPDAPPSLALDPLGRRPLVEEWSAGRLQLLRGPAQAFADAPSKAWGALEVGRLPSGALLDSTRLLLSNAFRAATEEVWLSSPYLVPGPEALQGMREATRAGVRISLITNSLAATDEPVVHTGYRRYRDNMLRAGVEVFELHPRLSQRLGLDGVPEGSQLRLHTKTAIIDQRQVFIGSVNFDPRSEVHNTEFGLLIQSPELAAEARSVLQALKHDASYEVRLKEGATRNLEWRHTDDHSGVEVLDSEPGADLGTRMKLYILSILIPESLL